VRAARDGDADVGVGVDRAVFERALRAVEEVEAGVGAVVHAAAADQRLGRGAVDGHARERARRDVAVFEQEAAARDLDGEEAVAASARLAAKRQPRHARPRGAHHDAARGAARDDDLFDRAVADYLYLFINRDALFVDAGADDEPSAGRGVLEGFVDARVIAAAVRRDDE
jgi:hypothetical protein